MGSRGKEHRERHGSEVEFSQGGGVLATVARPREKAMEMVRQSSDDDEGRGSRVLLLFDGGKGRRLLLMGRGGDGD